MTCTNRESLSSLNHGWLSHRNEYAKGITQQPLATLCQSDVCAPVTSSCESKFSPNRTEGGKRKHGMGQTLLAMLPGSMETHAAPCTGLDTADATKSKQSSVTPLEWHRMKTAGDHACRGSFVTRGVNSSGHPDIGIGEAVRARSLFNFAFAALPKKHPPPQQCRQLRGKCVKAGEFCTPDSRTIGHPTETHELGCLSNPILRLVNRNTMHGNESALELLRAA